MKEQPKSLVYIDTDNLPEEWARHPTLYLKEATDLADARKDLDELKASLEVAEAEADRIIRSQPEMFNITKVSESAIKNAVVLHKTVRDATGKLNEAKHLVAIREARVSALEHRKRALEKMVDLLLAGFFSVPRAKQENKESVSRMERDQAFKAKRRDND